MEHRSTNLCKHENWREIDTWPFCNDCGKRLDEPPSEERWSTDNPAKCDICGATCETHSRLSEHKQKHNSTPPTSTEEVNTPSELVSHLVDEDEDPTCASCGFGEWRHKDGFNCERFVSRTEPTRSLEGVDTSNMTLEMILDANFLTEKQRLDALTRRERRIALEARLDEQERLVGETSTGEKYRLKSQYQFMTTDQRIAELQSELREEDTTA